MRKLRAWLLRFKGLFAKTARERELANEIESHLQLHIDDNIRAGMSPEEAKRVAVMKLGGVDQTIEAYRDRATIPILESMSDALTMNLSKYLNEQSAQIISQHSMRNFYEVAHSQMRKI